MLLNLFRQQYFLWSNTLRGSLKKNRWPCPAKAFKIYVSGNILGACPGRRRPPKVFLAVSFARSRRENSVCLGRFFPKPVHRRVLKIKRVARARKTIWGELPKKVSSPLGAKNRLFVLFAQNPPAFRVFCGVVPRFSSSCFNTFWPALFFPALAPVCVSVPGPA